MNHPERRGLAARATAAIALLLILGGCAWIGHPLNAPHTAAASPATFSVAEQDLHQPLTVIAYGDMRFTDPANVTATNPAARQALIAKIAQERPDGLFLNGDVPYIGGHPEDYAEFHKESAP